MAGQAAHLGVSLTVLEGKEFTLVEEDKGTTYTDAVESSRRWEATHEVGLRFIALGEGLAELGGLRVLVMDEGAESVGREWERLGEVWVES